jgi:hypothetical protein
MKINWNFILIILLIFLFFFISDFVNIINGFTQLVNNSNQYRLIIVSNKNYFLLHFKNIINGSNQIYKIYKNKFLF